MKEKIFYNSVDIAAMAGCSEPTVRRMAQRLNLAPSILPSKLRSGAKRRWNREQAEQIKKAIQGKCY